MKIRRERVSAAPAPACSPQRSLDLPIILELLAQLNLFPSAIHKLSV
jgi:hypothetical protein